MHADDDIRRVLRRHFVRQFFDNDLLSPRSDQHGLFARTVALLMVPGLLVPVMLLLKYTHPYATFGALERASWSDKTFFIALTMAVIGLATVLEWDVLHVDRRDGLILGVLPIEPRMLLWAKMKALGLAFVMLAVATTSLGAFSFPLVMYARWPAGVTTVLRAIGGHAVASMCAAAFVFFTLLAVHGLLSALVPPRWFARVSSWMQMNLTLGLVVAILLLPLLAGSIDQLRASGDASAYVPYAWYVGLDEWLAGHADAVWSALAWRGCWALVVVIPLALVTNLMGFGRRLRRTLEATRTTSSTGGAAGRALAWLGGRGLHGAAARGFYGFSLATLSRSLRHRMIVAAFMGGAVAIGGVGLVTATYETPAGWHRPVAMALLAVELTFAALALVGVRAAAAAPAELRANWVLRLLDPGPIRTWMSGFRRAVWIGFIVPIAMAMGGLAHVAFGWQAGATDAVTILVWCGVTFELLFVGFGRVPFAVSVSPVGGSVQARSLVLGTGLALAISPVAWLVTFFSTSADGALFLGALGVALWGAAWWWHVRTMPTTPGAAFLVDDEGVQTLGLDQGA
jgi:hypothetical protein